MASNGYKIQRLSEQEFFAAEERWQDLLQRSDGNALFGSWYWASSWWRSLPAGYAGRTELCVLAIVAPDERWSALAPCHIVTTRRRGLPVRSLHIIGSGPGADNLFRSEYLTLLFDVTHTDTLLPMLMNAIVSQTDWDEAQIADVAESSALQENYRRHLPADWFSREINKDSGYSADLVDGFDAYIASLSASARRQMFNKRARLSQCGELRLRTAGAVPLEELATTLNRFHQRRFNRDVIRAEHAAFLEALTAHDNPAAPRLAPSLLEVAGKTLSAALDVDVNNTRYNIQLGFDADVDGALSPGLLHLGYAIEKAVDQQIDRYDFLIGGGLSHDYKARFASASQQISTLHWVRAPWLRLAHRIYQRIKRRAGE